jgi:hypothetical protein
MVFRFLLFLKKHICLYFHLNVFLKVFYRSNNYVVLIDAKLASQSFYLKNFLKYSEGSKRFKKVQKGFKKGSKRVQKEDKIEAV